MRKLKLELDALQVETFAPRADTENAPGTVRAHDSEDPPNTADPNVFSCNILSCGGTCWLTPNICGSCGCTGVDPECG